MFSKSKINEPGPGQGAQPQATPAPAPAPGAATRRTPTTRSPAPARRARPRPPPPPAPATGTAVGQAADYRPQAPKAKPPASILSSDLHIKGNIKTTGDVQIEGQVEGDIRAHLLTVGEGATVRGELVADDVVINGRIIGRVRGLKVRLTPTARAEGDTIHHTI